MRRSLALLVPALLLAAACTQSPTDATRQPTARFDGGNYFGSGNAVGGGNYGSGNAVGSGSVGGGASTDSGTLSNADGGIFYGSGNVTSSGPSTAAADSATTGERGVNTMGSGN